MKNRLTCDDMIEQKHFETNGCNILYLQSLCSGSLTIILLHGYNWTSDIWLESGTIAALNEAGVNTYAVDVPGFPNSRSIAEPTALNEEVVLRALTNLIVKITNGNKFFLLGASAGGYLALKLAIRCKKEAEGIVVVAPSEITKIDVSSINSRILTIYGAEDKELDEFRKVEHFKSKSEMIIIEKAGHRCYLDKPQEFNQLLIKFINSFS